jgi:hypothetical protein
VKCEINKGSGLLYYGELYEYKTFRCWDLRVEFNSRECSYEKPTWPTLGTLSPPQLITTIADGIIMYIITFLLVLLAIHFLHNATLAMDKFAFIIVQRERCVQSFQNPQIRILEFESTLGCHVEQRICLFMDPNSIYEFLIDLIVYTLGHWEGLGFRVGT